LTKYYCELYIKPNTLESGWKIIELLVKLNYRIICIEASNELYTKLRDKAKEWGVKTCRRITLKTTSDSETKRKLKAIRVKYDIVSVQPLGLSAARLAARDTRVDLIQLTCSSQRYIDRTELEMIKKNNKILEIPLKELRNNISNVLFLSKIRKVLRVVERHDINIAISSAAETDTDVWHPLHIASLLVLFGLSNTKALLTVTNTPCSLLTKFRGY